jgi:dipeptidase D
LGADNGIAVAMIMAIFADRSLEHGPIEALITSDEETGMEGVQKFDIKKIKSKYMINLDSENDEEICIGCPGNIDVEAELFFKRNPKPIPNSTNLRISISGGLGGHSGQTIHQKRINAVKHMFYLLTLINDATMIRLVNVEKAGIARNVIPFECAVDINVDKQDVSKVKNIVMQELKAIRAEYHMEKEIVYTCTPSKTKLLPIRREHSDLIIAVHAAVPNGVHTFN